MNVWKTGHEICDRVARSLAIGLNTQACHVSGYAGEDCNVAYGILRGTDRIFRSSREWFNVDNGYLYPRHFDGYYRISYRGTQAHYIDSIGRDHSLKLKPWRRGSNIMICPPTPAVCAFFGVDIVQWLRTAVAKCDRPYFIKQKDGSLDFTDVGKVITFNSAAGWLALAEGLEVDSDPLHSVVGSYYATKSIDTYDSFIHIDREPLFRFMRANQLTLREIERGDAWELINRYL